jgi:hypothetical protein
MVLQARGTDVDMVPVGHIVHAISRRRSLWPKRGKRSREVKSMVEIKGDLWEELQDIPKKQLRDWGLKLPEEKED